MCKPARRRQPLGISIHGRTTRRTGRRCSVGQPSPPPLDFVCQRRHRFVRRAPGRLEHPVELSRRVHRHPAGSDVGARQAVKRPAFNRDPTKIGKPSIGTRCGRLDDWPAGRPGAWPAGGSVARHASGFISPDLLDRPPIRPVRYQGEKWIPESASGGRPELSRHPVGKHGQPGHDDHAGEQQKGADLHRRPWSERDAGRLAVPPGGDNPESNPTIGLWLEEDSPAPRPYPATSVGHRLGGNHPALGWRLA